MLLRLKMRDDEKGRNRLVKFCVEFLGALIN